MLSATQGNVTHSQLRYLPVSLFGSVMGLCGLALGWRLAQHLFDAPPWVSEGIAVIAAMDFATILFAYLVKLARHPSDVVTEFLHPVAGNFFGTFTISLLLLSAIVFPYQRIVGEFTWVVATLLTVALAYISVSRMFGEKQEIRYVTPALMIPGVGVLNIPVTGGEMPFHWAHQVNIFAFSVGAIWALILLIFIIGRLLYHDWLPEKLIPSLMILFAPFSVGFLGYVNGVTHRIDLFASLLFYFGLFLFCVLYFKVFRRGLTFGPSWWAVSFPMAALSNSAIEYADHLNNWSMDGIAIILLALVTATIVVLLILSLLRQFRGTFLVNG